MTSWAASKRPCIVTDAEDVHAKASLLQGRWSNLQYLQAAHAKTAVEVSLTSDGILAGTVEANETTMMAFGDEFLNQVRSDKDNI